MRLRLAISMETEPDRFSEIAAQVTDVGGREFVERVDASITTTRDGQTKRTVPLFAFVFNVYESLIPNEEA